MTVVLCKTRHWVAALNNREGRRINARQNKVVKLALAAVKAGELDENDDDAIKQFITDKLKEKGE